MMQTCSIDRWLIRATLAVISMVVITSRARAAGFPLADRVPADAVVYVGWAGADAQSAEYRASQLSAFLDHSNLPDLARQYVPKLWDQLAGQSDDPKAVATLRKISAVLWKRPMAVYVSNVAIAADGSPSADFSLLIDAGATAVDLKSDIESLVGQSKDIGVSMQGDVITVAAKFSTAVRAKDGANDGAKDGAGPTRMGVPLAMGPRFTATMKSLQASPAIAIYVDAQTILEKANQSAAQNPQASVIWPKMRDALGIANVKSYAMTAGFDGGDWWTQSRLESPGPRTGLLAAIEPQPIDPNLLARIPATAGSVCVYNFNIAKIFDSIGEAMSAAKDSDTLFHQIAGGATVVLGRNLRRQIIEPLGPQWVMYSDSQTHSAVLMNHPSDADATADTMVSALFGLVNLANAQIPGARFNPVASIDQKTVRGLDTTSAITKVASPTVAVKDKLLYWGLSADSVVNAANFSGTPSEKSLLTSPDFLAARQRLGVLQLGSFDYCDIPKTAPAAYSNFGPAGDQVRQMLGLFQIDLPKVELPPLDQLKLTPALAVSWADAEGVYSKSICPFPGSTALLGDPQQGMVAASTVSGLAAVTVPALQRARTAARRTLNSANERQIVLAMILYANDHQGNLPNDAGSIVASGYLGNGAARIFLQPDSKVKIPADLATAGREKQAEWVNDHSEYTLLAGGKNLQQIHNAEQTAVLVPLNADQATEPVPVGFADGHVEYCKPERVKHLMHPDEPAEP